MLEFNYQSDLCSDKQPHTNFHSKQDAIDQLYEWISFIVEYREVHISDAIISLLKIEVPTGAGAHKRGRIVNKMNYAQSFRYATITHYAV